MASVLHGSARTTPRVRITSVKVVENCWVLTAAS